MWLSFTLGAFTIGIGIALVAWGAPYLPAPNVGVLVLLESVLAPVWVWLLLGSADEISRNIGWINNFVCSIDFINTKKIVLGKNNEKKHSVFYWKFYFYQYYLLLH